MAKKLHNNRGKKKKTVKQKVAKKRLASTGFIGFLGSVTLDVVDPNDNVIDSFDAFSQGVISTGATFGAGAGNDIRYIKRSANNKYNRLKANADFLVSQGVDLIVATGGVASAQAAARAAYDRAHQDGTDPVPILFIIGCMPKVSGDPLDDLTADSHAGINLLVSAQNLNRITKLTQQYSTVLPKQVALVVNKNSHMFFDETNDWGSSNYIARFDPNGDNDDVPFLPLFKQTLQDALDHGARGIVLSADPYFNKMRNSLTTAVAQKSLFACYPFKEYVRDANGHLSYGPSLYDSYFWLGQTTVEILGMSAKKRRNIKTLVGIFPAPQEDCFVP